MDGTSSGLYHMTTTSGSDTILIELRGMKKQNAALGWVVLSYIWRCCVWAHRILIWVKKLFDN